MKVSSPHVGQLMLTTELTKAHASRSERERTDHQACFE